MASPSASTARSNHVKTPKEECEALMNVVMPLAETLLKKHKEFYPFGATMSPSGEIAQTSAWTGEERPPSDSLITMLEGAYRDGAAQGNYKATALVVDVRTVPPGKSEKQDAVEIRLDHRENYSIRVLFPYSFSAAGELRVERPFAAQGEKRVFR